MCVCVPEIWFSKGKDWLTQTNACKTSLLFTPDMSSLWFSTEDIHTGPDRTLRTAGPAGTAPASSIGMWIDVSSAYLSLATCGHREHSACLCAQLCASRCHLRSRQFWDFSFMARWDCRSALRDRTAGFSTLSAAVSPLQV